MPTVTAWMTGRKRSEMRMSARAAVEEFSPPRTRQARVFSGAPWAMQ